MVFESSSQIALEIDNQALSYQVLDKIVGTLAEKLNALPQEWIVFPAKPSLHTIALLLALFRTDKKACPLSTRLPEELRHSLASSFSSHYWIDPETLPLTAHVSKPKKKDPSALSTALFTSGTTALPKIACHTLANHVDHALIANPLLGIDRQTRYLLSVPLFHVSGLSLLFRVLSAQGTLVVTSLPLEEALLKHQITHVSLVPTQLYRLLQSNKTHFPCLRMALVGGAALAPSLYEQGQKLPLYLTYGMTETSSMATLGKGPAAGKPIIPLRLKADGEIVVSGKTLFAGYLNPQTQQVDATPQEFATRDLGRFLDDGSLEILGRKDRLFISGGENIQPEEIEKALLSLPGIERAHVKAVPDPEFGQRPMAYLVTHIPYTLEEIRLQLKPLLPTFKHPICIKPFTQEMLSLKG